jgi:hypothetical protein
LAIQEAHVREPPFEIRNPAELVDAVSVAAQVEHAVLVEYLFAAFSCRHTQDPSVPVRAQMASWEAARELYLIAHEEMDHLGAVQQLLAALGAPPVPDAWTLPIRDERLPFPCELTRLDRAAVDRFIQTESPPSPVVGSPPRRLPTPSASTSSATCTGPSSTGSSGSATPCSSGGG